MQRRTSRTLSRAVVVAVVLAVGATIWQSWTAGTPGVSGVVQTSWGPLTPADRDLLVKVRLACLWEMSTGQQAQQQASSPEVREATRKIMVEHTELDEKVRAAADRLGVLLPSTPTAQQIGWMKDISSRTGSDYDRTVVQKLREAHGIVLPVIAQVRVGTRNDAVRAFAADTQDYVTRHITYLEGTGLVDYPALPETPSPGLLAGSTNWTDLIVPGLVLVACLLVAVALGATLRGRNRSGRPAPATPAARSTPAPRVATPRALISRPEARTPPRRAVPAPEPDLPDLPTPAHGIPVGTVPASRVPAAGASAAEAPAPGTPAPGIPAVEVSAPRASSAFSAARSSLSKISDSGRHAARR